MNYIVFLFFSALNLVNVKQFQWSPTGLFVFVRGFINILKRYTNTFFRKFWKKTHF